MTPRPQSGGRRTLARVGLLFLAYLAAGVVETVVFSEVRRGHADVPLSMFPEYLVLAPLMPVAVVVHLFQTRVTVGLDLLATAVFIVCFGGVSLVYRRVRGSPMTLLD